MNHLNQLLNKIYQWVNFIHLAQSSFLVSVMTFEHSFLLVDEGEESSKLIHINGSRHVYVKHVDHQSTGFFAEHRHVTICKSLTK